MASTELDAGSAFAIRSGVLGEDLVLNRTSGGGYILHEVIDGSITEIGCFERTPDAWKAIDALDLTADAHQRTR